MIRKTGQWPIQATTPQRHVTAPRPSVPESQAGWRPRSAARVSGDARPVTLQPRSQLSAEELIAQVNAKKAGAVQGASLGHSSSAINAEQLRQIMPNLSAERAQQMTPYLNRAMQEAGITTPKRAAAFLAQLAHESGQLRYFEELASGRAYEGRRDLGNTQPGDGMRFKGRGPIQLTGRANYEAASRDLGVDLVNHPELAARPDVGFRVAAWYWKKHGLNELADRGNFDGITQRINGGQNGAADRRQFFARANAALGAGFSGGPLATDSTPTPQYEAKPPRVYQTGRPGAGQPAGGASAPDAGFERMSQSYATRSSVAFDLFLLLLQMTLEGLDPETLASDPAFLQFAKEIGADWRPGEPVPQALAAEFVANRLAEQVLGGANPDALKQALGSAAGN